MDALVRKRKDVYQNVTSETLYIQEKSAHIREMAEKYSLPGYVDGAAIRKLYAFDLSYTSEVSGRQKQYREEESWWQNHRWLSRAEKFAVGAVEEHLQSEKRHLFAQLNDRVKKAQEADARAVARLEAAYDGHITKVDAEAEKVYNDGLERREKAYQNYLRIAKNEDSIDQLEQAEIFFCNNRAYKDSKNLIEHCEKRIADLTAEKERKEAEHRAAEAAERERQRCIAEQKCKAQQKRNKTIAMIVATCVVLAVAVTLVVTKVVIPGNAYKEAVALAENGQYGEAMNSFAALGTYKDSVDRMEECKSVVEKAEAELRAAEQIEMDYQYAISVLSYGIGVDYSKISEAHDIFERLGDYKESQIYLTQFTKRHIQTTRTPNTKDYPKNLWYDEYGREYDEGYVYDERGRLVRSGNITIEYNDKNQLTKFYDGCNYTFECSYDDYGNMTVLKTIYTATAGKNKGKQTVSYETYEYQYENDLVINEKVYSDYAGEKRISSSQDYKYDSNGNVVESTVTYYRYQTIGNSTDTAYYWYTYNEDGSKKQIEYKRGKDTNIETFVYDWVWAPKHS